MTEKELEKLKTLEKWETDNQGLIKGDWKLLEVYKEIKKPHQKYCIIECIHCGETRLVLYYNFLKKESPRPCTKCGGKWITWGKSMVGKIVGHYKILKYIECIKRISNNKIDVFFKVQCIYCGDIKERELYNKSNWNRYKLCPKCPRRRNDYYTVRYKEYQNGAKSRNLAWNLSLEDFIKISTSNCFYCGAEAQVQNRVQHGCLVSLEGNFNGIDRVDSNYGYTVDNCVPCCSHCNMMKMHYTKEEFLSQIYKIYLHSIKQGQETIENTSNDGSEQSTLQANGNGSGGCPIKDNEIVQSIQ